MSGNLYNRQFRRLKRALVVEQLSADQWHIVTGGTAVAEGAPEARPSAVASMFDAMSQAIERARYYGLPVVVQPLSRPLRWPSREEVETTRFPAGKQTGGRNG